MRRYIRHPTSMPIDYRLTDGVSGEQHLRNVSAGGICFAAQQAMALGVPIHLTIHLGEQEFDADGEVVWCHGVNGHHEIGVRFKDAATVFTVRMVEQLCYIEQYRQQVRQSSSDLRLSIVCLQNNRTPSAPGMLSRQLARIGLIQFWRILPCLSSPELNYWSNILP